MPIKPKRQFSTTPVKAYYAQLKQDPHHRYRSWEHCFSAFQTSKDEDHLSLNLAFYLASFGMYRGSSGLLQKDYKIHNGAVNILLKPKYRTLHCGRNREVRKEDINKIIELKEELKDHYRSALNRNKSLKRQFGVSDTLISKILLGSLGCTPALDRYFIAGISKHGFSCRSLTKKSLASLFEFIRGKEDVLSALQNSVSIKNVHYPLMKLIDMYFWQVGISK